MGNRLIPVEFDHVACFAVVVREGSQEPVTVTANVGRELLHISSVSLPGTESKYSALLNAWFYPGFC